MSGDRPCGSGRVSDRSASVYASPPQAPCEVLQERLFPAEQMGRARSLDPNAIRPVRRDKRAVAHAPGREPSEPFVVRLWGGFGHVKLGHERLRMSNRETKPKAERLCRLIRRYNDPAREPIFVAMRVQPKLISCIIFTPLDLLCCRRRRDRAQIIRRTLT
jgi:hypothetical protein